VRNLPVGSVNNMPVVACQSTYKWRVQADGGSGGAAWRLDLSVRPYGRARRVAGVGVV
jgi:hypothetical protein